MLRENRVFAPPAGCGEKHVKSMAQYELMYKHSVEQPGVLGGGCRGWSGFQPWTKKVLETEMKTKWLRVGS